MNIQLFLEGQEVELTNDIIFPLNKTFENLANPTEIIVEYSKTINIPMTKINNEIMGHAYSINRTIPTSTSQPNIGLYFDPNKRIPFRLIYNGNLLMEGYAKFTSANYSTNNKYYSLNLYGALGDVFHKLKEVPVEEIDDHCNDREDNSVFNNTFAWTSFNVDDPQLELNNAHSWEIIGMAPAYRGLYPNFKSDQKYSTVAQEGSTEGFKSFAVELRDEWKDRYARQKYNKAYVFLTDAEKQAVDTYIDGLDPEGAIGDGLADNQVHEYRSYHQRPYIYFNKLMQMYQEKCQELTGYTISLDPYWFNPSNPYWTRSCYMLDYLTSDGVETEAKQQIAGYKTSYYSSRSGANKGGLNTYLGYFRKGTSTRFDMASFTLNFHHQVNYTAETTQDLGRITAIGRKLSSIDLRYNTYSRYIISIYAYPLDSNGNYNSSNYRTKVYWAAADPFNASDSTYSPSNNTELVYASSYEMGPATNNYYTAVYAKLDASCSVPASTFYGDFTYGAYLRVNVECNNTKETYFTSYYCPASVNPTGPARLPAVTVGHIIALGSSTDYDITGPTNYISSNMSSLPVSLQNVWKKEETPFNVILEYTKMFGLVWSVDYMTKTITIAPRGRYFDGYTIESWDDKLDRSKDFIVEPVIFPSKYIEFGYDSVDGYRYKQYKEKYNMEYGGLKIKTNYDFNTEAEPLFENIQPSISSNRNIIHYSQLLNWDLVSVIRGVPDPVERIECADVDDSKELNMNNWYLRGENIFTSSMPYNSYVTDDNAYMIEHDNYCYYDMIWHNPDDPIHQLQAMPQFSAVYKEGFDENSASYGILFNQPNEDYTTNKVYTEAGGNYIYNLFWNNYISERYNIQNKKLTAYFRLNPSDYFDFKFNKFVTIDNQLFCINKIFDYNIQSTEPTKVELIQITDPNNYSNVDNLFDPIQLSTDHYSLETTSSGGTFSFYVRPIDRDNTNITIPDVSPNDMYTEDLEYLSYGWMVWAITWEIPNAGGSIETTITITCDGFTREFPVKIVRS